MPSPGAAPRAAVSVSNARAEASRKNGARSPGPKTPEGKARSARNALKHGMRAQKCTLLPDEDAAEFAQLEAAMLEELAPVGALQTVLARRIAVAAWRLARADCIEADLFQERSYGDAGSGLALIRDGNGTRSFETLLRYRGAAMAEFWRALRMLKALQAEQAREAGVDRAALPQEAHRITPAGPQPLVERAPPDGPGHGAAPQLEYLLRQAPAGRGLHESPAAAQPNEPEPMPATQPERLPSGRAHARANEPGPSGSCSPGRAASPGARRAAPGAITPPREHRNPAAALVQLAKSTP